jgi:peptidoglycan/LPS O-acetylase OafA/YrhL
MKNSYRPEIDGLRAIAVFSVIFYHADLQLFGKKLFSGGFLGVDIFFVISGYLITSIIFKEIYFTNKFSFTKFYEKRIRRIIPPFIFVILCSLPFAYYALLPSFLIEFSKSIISSVFFISNFYFYSEENNYWKESSKEIPFLHTWSLSIEEQFYIIFPIIIFIIYKLFRKKIIFIVFFGILLSLLFNLYNKSNPLLNFYMPHTRAFELLLGSTLSYFEFFYITKKLNTYKISKLNSIIGIILISYSI